MFLVILPKAHLTSHSKIPGSKGVTTPSCLSRSLRPFLYTSSVCFCHLFFISSASVRSFWFVLYCAHLGMKCSLGILNFLEQISRLSLPLFFPPSIWISRIFLDQRLIGGFDGNWETGQDRSLDFSPERLPLFLQEWIVPLIYGLPLQLPFCCLSEPSLTEEATASNLEPSWFIKPLAPVLFVFLFLICLFFGHTPWHVGS